MVALLLLSAPSGADGIEDEICLYEGYSDRELARYALGASGSFSLSFIHSVSLTPVTDIYEIRPTGIHQVAEVFEAHGAGLPSFAGDIGATEWHRENGKFILEMDRQFDRIQLRIQREYRNRLHAGEQEITLADFGADVVGMEICADEGD